jgi:hypothetical protein
MTTSIFAASFVICMIMIVMRNLELRQKKAFFHTNLLNKVDVVMETKLKTVASDVVKKKHEAVFFVTHNVPFYVWNKARDLTGGFRQKYEKIERTIRGRNMIKQMGEASEYMKNISEYKNTPSVNHPDFTEDKIEDKID